MTGNQRAYRPAPASCLWCPRDARLHRRYPHLAQSFCSDRCEAAHYRHQSDTEARQAANQIRALAGLPSGRGRHFTRPELVALARRLERVMPAGGISRYPAPHRSTGGTGMTRRKAS